MSDEDIICYQHSHDFAPDRHGAEKNTHRVIVLAAIMMVIEIVGGWKLHSMALLADGWHMSTHVAAFFITALAYALARRHRHDRTFSFGTGKVDVLGGFSSAIILSVVAVFMTVESISRLFAPEPIHFNESIAVAALGLVVNLASALLLGHTHGDHHHGHDHSHDHDHDHTHDHGPDLNMRAAYVHVLTDAITSILALFALITGKYLGWVWLDPVMGLVGAALVGRWAWLLLRDAGLILLDREPPTDLRNEIRSLVESDGDARVTDLHVWQIGMRRFAAIVSLVARNPKTPEYYRERLLKHKELLHLTVEIQQR